MGPISNMLTRRSAENPSVPLSQLGEGDEAYSAMAGGERASSGVRVNHKSALTYPAFWRGINLVSGDVGRLPILVYRRLPGGGKERAIGHPAYPLLRRRASPYLKTVDFMQTLTAHGLGIGNGYGYIFRRGDGTPMEMLVLNPLTTYPVREQSSGRMWYVTTMEHGEQRKLLPSDVLHIRGLGFDGLVGYNVLEYAKETLGLGLGIRKYGSIFFKNDATPNMVLLHPGKLTKDAQKNLRESWNTLHQGLDNKHRLAVLAEDMKVQLLSVDARKAQLLEMRQFEIREVANILGVPPHKLGDPTRTAYASLEQENQAYVNEALDRWLVQWETECTEKLLSEEEKEKDTHFCEFLRAALVRADIKARYEAYKIAIESGWMKRNEPRVSENLDSDPRLDGFIMPLNMQVVGELDGDADEPATSPEEAKATADLDYKREVVKLLIQDGTIGDVVFNLMDGRRLLEKVNIDAYQDAEEPWLPVVAAMGPLVSGEVIVDVDGGVVGGDVLASASGVPDAAAPIAGDADAEEKDGGSIGVSLVSVDLEDDEAVRAVFNRILAEARRRRQALIASQRELLVDALRRMHRRVCVHARKAARQPAGFVAWLDGPLDGDHREIFIQAVGPALRAITMAMWSDVQADAEVLAHEYFAGVRAALLQVAECKAGELAGAVDRWAEGTAESAAVSLARKWESRNVESRNHESRKLKAEG